MSKCIFIVQIGHNRVLCSWEKFMNKAMVDEWLKHIGNVSVVNVLAL